MTKQKLGILAGLPIVVSHIALVGFLLVYFQEVDGSKVVEVAAPITVAYVSSVVLWFMANDKPPSADSPPVGVHMVVLVSILVATMICITLGLPLYFYFWGNLTIEQLNSSFFVAETFLGGIFGLIMSYLYGYKAG